MKPLSSDSHDSIYMTFWKKQNSGQRTDADCQGFSREEVFGVIKMLSWDFPGGPAAKTWISQYRGLGINPWSGN